MHFFRTIEHFITHFSTTVPLPFFVFIGSFFEEVISPIPSALVMGTAGSLALIQGNAFVYLFLLAFVGNFGKMLGAWLYYFIGDTLEDALVKPITKYLGVKHTDIENIGKYFTGHHWKDGGILFLIRMMPPFPTTPVSIACGIFKMDLRVFLLATYAGNFFKDLMYLYIGYAGLASFRLMWHQNNKLKFGINIAILLAVISFLVFLFLYRGRGKKCLKYCRDRYTKFFESFSEKK